MNLISMEIFFSWARNLADFFNKHCCLRSSSSSDFTRVYHLIGPRKKNGAPWLDNSCRF